MVAKAKKKTSKKKKAKKARKSSPARASKKAAAKKRAAKSKRVVKKSRKASKKAAKKAVRRRPRKPQRSRLRRRPPRNLQSTIEETGEESCSEEIRRGPEKHRLPSTATSSAEKKPEAAAAREGARCRSTDAAASRANIFYVTTPIFYPNGMPHIGHAYTAMVTDAIARFQRLDGKDVRFLTGTDEHGLKMQQTAVAEGLTPIALADRNSARFRDMMTALNISNDDFIRTTEPRHKRGMPGDLASDRSRTATSISTNTPAGIRCVRRLISTKTETTLGDDGIRREPLGSPVEWTEEETYFFRLSAYQDKLLELYETQPDFVCRASGCNEVVELRQRRPEGPVGLAHHVRLGRPGAGRPRACDVCLGGCADQLHHAAGYPDVDGAESGATGRPICTSPARTSCASTPCTGPHS